MGRHLPEVIQEVRAHMWLGFNNRISCHRGLLALESVKRLYSYAYSWFWISICLLYPLVCIVTGIGFLEYRIN